MSFNLSDFFSFSGLMRKEWIKSSSNSKEECEVELINKITFVKTRISLSLYCMVWLLSENIWQLCVSCPGHCYTTAPGAVGRNVIIFQNS